MQTRIKFITIIILLVVGLILQFKLFPPVVFAQEIPEVPIPDTYQGEILSIESEADCSSDPDSGVTCEYYLVAVEGFEEPVSIPINPNDPLTITQAELAPGAKVFVDEYEYGFVISGIVRQNSLLLLTGLFIGFTLLISRWQGLGSLFGLLTSIIIIFVLVIPLIVSGYNAYLVGYFAALLILITSLLLSHGINKKSLLAFLASACGLLLVAVLTTIFLGLGNMTGLGSEEVLFLADREPPLDLLGVLFISILLGGIGVLDDITVNQISLVGQIRKANPRLSIQEIYRRSMVVGRDHIASLTNTLFIAYASSSLPLMFLLALNNSQVQEIINSELFAEVILRILISTIGLIVAVPISSFMAAYYLQHSPEEIEEFSHGHTHV